MPAGPEPTTATDCPVSWRGGRGHDPALIPGAIDDRELDLFDRDGVVLADLQHARRLARRGAQTAGQLGEVVRRVQMRDRILPAVAVDEVVPVGDQVAERAAVVAEGHAAVHAARALLAQLLGRAGDEELAIVVRALVGVPVGNPVALDLQEPAELAHQTAVPSEHAGVERSELCPAGVHRRYIQLAHQAATAEARAAGSAARSASTRL